MNFRETSEFKRNWKKLSKKYRSLDADIKELKKIIKNIPTGTGSRFTVLHIQNSVKIIKVRLHCQYLKQSSLRIIYAYHERTNEIEFIEFIELYAKNQQTRENKEKIYNYLKGISGV